jgi:hypothetical protein
MALARQNFLFEDNGFNLGMDPGAFRNFAPGIMGLDGASTTVANPLVAENLMNQAVAKTTEPTLTAADLPPTKVLTNAATTAPADLTLDQVYQQVLGRAGDVGGLQHWSEKFGETVDPTELALFTAEAAPELKAKDIYSKYVTGYDPTQEAIDLLRQEFVKPGAKEEDVLKSFLNPADAKAAADRMFLMQADPDYVAFQQALKPTLDTSSFPKFEGRTYDPTAYDNIYKQLEAQQKLITDKTGFKYESTFGGPQETIADMAKRLAASGISDIRDFGQRYSVVAEPIYETIQGDEGGSQTFDTGKYRTITGIEGYDSEGAPIYKYRELTPSEMKRLKFDEEGMAFLDATKKDIASNPFAESVYYNKKTGEVIDKQKIGGKAESGIWGSSGSGDGYTNYRVQYTESGMPIFVPEKNLSGMKEFVAQDLPGILSVLRFVPPLQLPVMLAQAGAAAYMGAKPGDILKNLATSYITSNLDKITGAALKEFDIMPPTTDMGKLALEAGKSGLASLIQGGDLEDALRSGLFSAASTGVSNLLPDVKPGDFNYRKVLPVLASALADGKISNADAFRLIQAAAVPTKKKRPGTP